MTLSITDTEHDNALQYAKYHCAKCCVLFIGMLNVDMLNVVMLNVVMLNVVMLNVIMQSVVMLSIIKLSVGVPYSNPIKIKYRSI